MPRASNSSTSSTPTDPTSTAEQWWSRLRTLGYSAFFPLLLLFALIAPIAVATTSSVTLFHAVEFTFAAVGVGYVVGLVLLLR